LGCKVDPFRFILSLKDAKHAFDQFELLSWISIIMYLNRYLSNNQNPSIMLTVSNINFGIQDSIKSMTTCCVTHTGQKREREE
jgi:hypothetical protein